MGEEKFTLALAFLQSHPEAAASILEQHEIEEVAVFISGISFPVSARLIQHLLPNFAARLCSQLPRETTAGILSRVDIGQVAAILRPMNKTGRDELLNELPTKAQIGCALLLNYSEDLVGAWITPHIATLPQDCLVREALNYLKKTPDLVHTDFLFIVDRERELKGRIRLIDLLKAGSEFPVRSLAEPEGETLRGRMRLAQAANHKDWKRFHEIPVINRNHKFIGVLRHVELRKGLDHLAPDIDPLIQPGSLEGVVQAYSQSLVAVFDSMKHLVTSDFQHLEHLSHGRSH